jgi:hypothetical protein
MQFHNLGPPGGPDCPYALNERVSPQRDPPVDPGNGLVHARAVRAVPKPHMQLAHHDTELLRSARRQYRDVRNRADSGPLANCR